MTDEIVEQFEEDLWTLITEGESSFLTFTEMADVMRNAADSIDPYKKSEEVVVSSSVLSSHDTVWDGVVDYLKKHGVIDKDELVTAMDVHVSAEEAITVSNIETVRR